MSTTFLIQNQDVVFNSSTGRPRTVSNGDKLSQDLKELFDSTLDPLIGLVSDVFAFRAELTTRIRQGVRALQLLQQQYAPETRPPEERINRIANIQVNQVIAPGDEQPSKIAYSYQVDLLTDAVDQPATVTGVTIGPG